MTTGSLCVALKIERTSLVRVVYRMETPYLANVVANIREYVYYINK